MKKKTARLTLPQEATERTKLGKTENKQKMKNTHRYDQIQEITTEAFRCTNQLTRGFWVYAATKRVLVKVHEVLKIWKIRNKKIIHKPTNQGQSMKHNGTSVTLQEMLNEIKLIGKEIEISQIDHTISTHGDTNALSINTLTKTKKQIESK
jgi:hypothetical protein